MDQGIIFCRTKLDCDNLEKYLSARGGGEKFRHGSIISLNLKFGYFFLEKYMIPSVIFTWLGDYK